MDSGSCDTGEPDVVFPEVRGPDLGSVKLFTELA